MRFPFVDQRCHGPAGRGFGGPFNRHRGEGFGGSGPRGPGGRMGRMFEQGDLRIVILKLLSEKPAHGYEIIKSVEQRFGGAYAPSPGIVYPTLTLLEEQGLIAVVENEGPRKLYGLTDEGRADLERSGAEVERIFARMDDIGRRFGEDPTPELRRAVDNLKMALRLRVERGRRDGADVTGRLTAILDGAARAIEEL